LTCKAAGIPQATRLHASDAIIYGEKLEKWRAQQEKTKKN
jgi:hypothetical protein